MSLNLKDTSTKITFVANIFLHLNNEVITISEN